MIRRPPRSTRHDTLFPYTTLVRSELSGLESEQARSRAESDELRQAIHRLRGSIGGLNREGRTRLLAAFAAVDGHFQRLFTALFDGGQAHLKLIDSDDPLEAGLEIMAQPPRSEERRVGDECVSTFRSGW